MKKYNYKVSVPAPNPKDADKIVGAMMKMAPYLNADEWEAFAKVVVSDPAKVAMAKSFLGFNS